MSDISHSLSAARAVEALMNAARDLMADAQRQADDVRLLTIAQWIGRRVESLDDELLVELRATIEALEKRRQAEKTP